VHGRQRTGEMSKKVAIYHVYTLTAVYKSSEVVIKANIFTFRISPDTTGHFFSYKLHSQAS
jgi:hypothetical protein